MKTFALGLKGRTRFVFFACALVLGLLTATPAGAASNTAISGTVTSLATGLPVPNICVFAGSTDGGTTASNTTTAADGTYTLNNLNPDTYSVSFFTQGRGCAAGAGDYAQQWYNGSPFTGTTASLGLAVTTVAATTTTGINAVMAAGSDISGTVTNAVGGADLQNICVFATDPSGVDYGTVATAANGTYDISGLAANSYVVDFYSSTTCNGATVTAQNFAQQWYSTTDAGTDVRALASPVALTAGLTHSGINASMAGGATVTGTVTAATGGANLPNVCVHAYGSNGFDGTATTAADGTFTITGLPADNYQFEWDPTCNFTITTLLEDVVTAPANDVALAAGSSTDESFALQVAGVISGTVTAAVGGADLAGVCVTVDQTGNGVSRRPIKSTTLRVPRPPLLVARRWSMLSSRLSLLRLSLRALIRDQARSAVCTAPVPPRRPVTPSS
ncbi:MAG: carboxypeptidase regulatory-like domain-containing protein [Acidimicrobiales bacterium]